MARVFAYGSNMLVERMTAANRAPSASIVGIAECRGRKLTFRKESNDGSGKCDATPGDPLKDTIYGVLFDVPDSEMSPLDKAEGCGHGYHRESVSIRLSDGNSIVAVAYIADLERVNDAILPYDWYLNLVKAGAEQNNLPGIYQKQIAATASASDPQLKRKTKLEAEKALAAYRVSKAAKTTGLPAMTRERFFERLVELVCLLETPSKFKELPLWTQKVLRTLKSQFFSEELEQIFAANNTMFVEGVAVAFATNFEELRCDIDSNGFIALMAGFMKDRPELAETTAKLTKGSLTSSEEFRSHVLSRIFASDRRDRRLFSEGLALGHRLKDIIDGQSPKTTDATAIYVVLWLYWPEVNRLGSVAATSRAIEAFFSDTPNLIGGAWEERFRKLANRIGLSLRARQTHKLAP